MAILLALLGACDADEPTPAAPRATSAPTAVPYRPGPVPARAVLPLVPAEVRVLAVTDFDAARAEAGVPGLAASAPAAERQAFWTRARAKLPLLSTGPFGLANGPSAQSGVGRDDVAWLAEGRDAHGRVVGWVARLRGDVDWAAVRRAAADDAGPLHDAEVRPDAGLVLAGAFGESTDGWASADDVVRLVADVPAAVSTYVERGCRTDPEGTPGLAPLTAYAVTFDGGLATAWLGPDRLDLFERLRVARADPGFEAAFAGGVADPGTGRIGFRLVDPPAAARHVLEHGAPVAACAEG